MARTFNPQVEAVIAESSRPELVRGLITALEDGQPDTRHGRGISSGTFYNNLRRYLTLARLPLAGVHVFRHSAAKLRRDAGESVEEVSRFLDHSNLATTTTYLRRLEGEQDRSWGKIAETLGLQMGEMAALR